MRVRQHAVRLFSAMVIVLCAASTATGQVATFSNITDAVPTKFFDAETTAADPNDPNTLVIGFNSGTDPFTWKKNDFRASTAAFSHDRAMDTISFMATAPTGFYISKITYRQSGSGSVVRTGKASGGATWVVGGYALSLGMFSTDPSLTGTADLTGLNLTAVPVSITNGLFVFSTPSLGSATVALTAASVTVELLPLAR
jgi:hypothetical protein